MNYCSSVVVKLSTVGLLMISAAAWGTQPPDVVQSDNAANTAMGTNALLSLTSPGSYNTAVGDGTLSANTAGVGNTATGAFALSENTTGFNNTGLGENALQQNTTGSNNTASGVNALLSNQTGGGNTASGTNALTSNTTGSRGTATGWDALQLNTSGSDNTAFGQLALWGNTTGSRNNAAGSEALYNNTTANDNNAMGYVALYGNMTGTLNNAVGNFSLFTNITGNNNNAIGYAAMYRNEIGSNNNAQGFWALSNNTSGNGNIAIGQYAGANQTTGSWNIYLGNPGVAGENDVIRIGNSATQTTTFIAGVSTAKVTGSAVYVTASGQLGVLASSERYKTSIMPMGSSTDRLQRLRPVTFQLKSDPGGVVQYGLVAEDVATVYPELVIRDDAGTIEGVRYDELAPMLLNELQQERQQLSAQSERAAAQEIELVTLRQQLNKLQDLVSTLRATGSNN